MFTSIRTHSNDFEYIERNGSLSRYALEAFSSPFLNCLGSALFLILPLITTAQQTPQDSVKALSEVTVQAFGQRKAQTTATVTTIDYAPRSGKTSLVNDFNTIPGVRMEERSPGSYRINIRGSSLRSPFGVRNVKVYWNQIPITDPGGNTYFNQLAFNNFSTIEVFKGPVASMYGAGTGGLILIDNGVAKQNSASLEYIRGSYNLQSLFASGNVKAGRFSSKLTYAHNASDGFRQQSALRRDNVSWTSDFEINERQRLSASILYTDMYYQTPGALTSKEFDNDPRAARPAAGAFPSAIDAKAAIFQKNFLAGLTYANTISTVFSNTTTLYGAYADIKNSAVRNYEKRIEPHFGGRTTFRLDKKLGNGFNLEWNAGGEIQQGDFNISVYGNRNGRPDTLQTNDDVNTLLYSLFTQATLSQSDKWFYTAGISYNKSRLKFTRLNDVAMQRQPFAFSNEVAPRFTVMRKLGNEFSVLAAVSKGFSPPTIAELLPSTGIINTELKAERGWNYELTLKKYLLNNKLYFEATGFYLDLKNALVQLRDEAGADYFVNAGNNQQKGLELNASYLFLPRNQRFVRYGNIKAGYAYNDFSYKYYSGASGDFSGNRLPGIPGNNISLMADINFRNGFYINSTYYGASSVFLNDANTAAARPYHLLMGKVGYQFSIKKIHLNLYAGADNLLNENYSLGNDINAVGGRYYNAAPRRNYYAGAAIQYKK